MNSHFIKDRNTNAVSVAWSLHRKEASANILSLFTWTGNMNVFSSQQSLMTQMTIPKPITLVLTLTLLSSMCVVDMAEQINFQYSMKNIPVPPRQEYHLEFIHSVREFIKRMKWRSLFYLNPQPTAGLQKHVNLPNPLIT